MLCRILTILLAAAGLAGATDGGSNTFGWSGHLDPGQLIEIKGLNGSIRAEATTGTEVEVTAEKSGRRYDPADVEIALIDNDNGLTICAIYPDHHGSPNECRPGGAGHMDSGDNDVKVEFVVRVPEGVRFTGRTVNGGVQAVHLGADVEAHTVNGKIDVTTSGTAVAETVNGSIRVSLGSGAWDGARKFTTVNGSIEVKLPADINADLAASTMNGHICSDFPITVRRRSTNRRAHGTIGTGGRALKVSTVNGSITVARVTPDLAKQS
jgi:Putative adhesin